MALYFDILKCQVNNKMGDLSGEIDGWQSPATCHSAHYLVAQLSAYATTEASCSRAHLPQLLTPGVPYSLCPTAREAPTVRSQHTAGPELLLTSTRESFRQRCRPSAAKIKWHGAED